jgi:hypothetical protein
MAGLDLARIKPAYFPLQLKKEIEINLGICIAPTQPFQATLGAESRVCYPGNTADRLTQWALTYYHLSQSTNQKGKLIHCHRWDSNSWSSECWRTFLTTRPSPIPLFLISSIVQMCAQLRLPPYLLTEVNPDRGGRVLKCVWVGGWMGWGVSLNLNLNFLFKVQWTMCG